MKNIHFLFYILVISLFLGIVSMPLFSEGMFMDGLLYSAISHNMANGLGNFWQPYLSHSVFPEFYEHPPLALGLQSLWFYLFGDSVLVERFYSLFTYLLSGIGLVSVWVQLGKSVKTGWIPLFFWLMVSNVMWAVSNNMLENTMVVFVIFAAYSYLKGINKNKIIFVVFSGLLLNLGFLSKGFVCFYIWAFPLGLFLFTNKITSKKTVLHTFIIISSTVVPLLCLYLFSENANNNLTSYFNKQVMGSLKNVTNVNTRFSIFWEFIQHTIIPLIIGGIILVITKVNKRDISTIKKNKQFIYLMSFILFCGIAPIMISMKQRGFYILTVYPFFGLAMGLIVLPIIKNKLEDWQNKKSRLNLIKSITLLLTLVSITMSIFQFGKIRREIDEVKDCKLVIDYIGTDKSIDICHSQYSNWSKHGYYSRYGNITLDRKDEKTNEYYLVNNSECSLDESLYEQTQLKLYMHKLYRKK